jgi:integrase
MNVSETALEKFRNHLREDGRSEGTADLYVLNVRSCAGEDFLTQRLTDARHDLGAKTLHTNKAALAAWADFTGDTELKKRLDRIKLPPAIRAKAKKGLSTAEWKTLMATVKTARLEPAIRATILIMARRGFRIADVLRLKKREIADALRTGTLSFEGKGRRRREIDVAPIKEALELLHGERGSWAMVEDLITATTREGLHRRKMAAKRVAAALRRCAKKAKVPGVHPHRLRRTYAMRFLELFQGDPQALIKLQKHMGWANMNTALSYVDEVNLGELDAKGTEMMRMLDA